MSNDYTIIPASELLKKREDQIKCFTKLLYEANLKHVAEVISKNQGFLIKDLRLRIKLLSLRSATSYVGNDVFIQAYRLNLVTKLLVYRNVYKSLKKTLADKGYNFNWFFSNWVILPNPKEAKNDKEE